MSFMVHFRGAAPREGWACPTSFFSLAHLMDLRIGLASSLARFWRLLETLANMSTSFSCGCDLESFLNLEPLNSTCVKTTGMSVSRQTRQVPESAFASSSSSRRPMMAFSSYGRSMIWVLFRSSGSSAFSSPGERGKG